MTAALFSVAISTTSTSASAQSIFFGENLNPGQGVSGDPVTARSAFLASLSGVSTEGFEAFGQGSSPSSLSFTGSAGTISANFAPSSGIICATNSCNGNGRFATEGTHYFDVSSAFSATFSSPIAAFGFYGTDVGDFNGQLTIELLRSSGISSFLIVPHTIGAPDASLLFYGVIDQANPFDGIRFGNTASGSDFFGFDQITIGDVRQVVSVPEPVTWAMMLIGFGFIGAAVRRHKAKGQAASTGLVPAL